MNGSQKVVAEFRDDEISKRDACLNMIRWKLDNPGYFIKYCTDENFVDFLNFSTAENMTWIYQYTPTYLALYADNILILKYAFADSPFEGCETRAKEMPELFRIGGGDTLVSEIKTENNGGQ